MKRARCPRPTMPDHADALGLHWVPVSARGDLAGCALVPPQIRVGFDRQLEVIGVSCDSQDVHVVDVEHRIGPDAPARAGTTRTVIHIGVFSSIGCLVASDREGPDSLLTSTPRRSS